MKAFLGQLRAELTLSLRNGEQLLVTLGIPLLVLLFLPTVDVVTTPTDEPIDYFAPSVLALAVMSTALVSLGVGTGFDRQYGVLKRLGASPLGRPRLVAAKVAMVLVIEVLQWCVLVPVAIMLGWSADGAWAQALLAVLLGTMAFAGLGLLLAGTLPGLMTLAAANLTYLVFLATSGMMFPLDRLPDSMATISRWFPAAPLNDAITGAFGSGVPGQAWLVLGVWAVVFPTAAALLFRWE